MKTAHSYKNVTVNSLGERKLGGSESQVIYRAGQTVSARLMEFHIQHPPASSVDLLGEGSEKEQWLLPTFLSGRKLPHLPLRCQTL